MRASPPIALALLALTPCFGATVEEIAERSMPSVVQIVTYDDTGTEKGQASGFFISPQKIITNEHVIDGAYSAEIFTDEGYYDRITVLNADEEMDLAILRVDADDEVPLPINPDAELKPGQRVIAIGHPLGLHTTVSDGLISGVRTTDQVQFIQITAPISKGSSGGPVLDEEGRVIGVVYAGIDEGQNLNFAVGVKTLNEFLVLEKSPRQLKVAGSYVLWRVVVRWIVTVIGALIALAFSSGGWVIVTGIALVTLLWHMLPWLWKSIYRRLTLLFRQRGDFTVLVSHEATLIVGVALLIGASWFLFASLNSATERTQSTVAPTESAQSTETLLSEWRSFCLDRAYVAARRNLIVGVVLLIAGSWFVSARVNSATRPTESTVTQIESAPSTDT